MTFLQAFQTAVTKVMDFGLRESFVFRFLRPGYEQFLHVASLGKGIDWLINGEMFRIDPRQRRRLGHVYEREVAALLKEKVRGGMTFVDVGANVGAYVLQGARLVGSAGRVVAFEPNPAARDVLARHVTMNGFSDRVTIVPVAVGSAAGTASLHAEDVDGMTRLERANPALRKATSLTTVVDTLDNYFTGGSPDPDVLLVDVEGFEANVLSGARALLSRTHGSLLIIVEMHPAAWELRNSRTEDMRALLAEARLSAQPLSGQQDPLADHGIVQLVPTV